jgi:hypothetical protein
MKSTVSLLSPVRCLALALGMIVISLSAATKTQAMSSENSDVLRKTTRVVVYLSAGQASTILHNPTTKAELARFVLRNLKLNPRDVKALPKACGCPAAPQELAGFGSCMKGCLADAGVSYYSIIMCGAGCFTGNIIICAICTGVGVAVVEVCTLGCAAYPGPYGGTKIAIQTWDATNRHRPPRAKSKLRLLRSS